jgi:hypothetical protein
MAQYTGIQGQNILIVSSDPANPVEGQIWYNTTSNLLKGYSFTPASWATGGPLNTSRSSLAGSTNGTPTAMIAMGGATPTVSAAAETYNGTSWTTITSMPAARRTLNGSGVQTAALAMGGATATNSATTDTQYWNGSSWSGLSGMPDNRRHGGTCGTLTSTLYMGGFYAPPSVGPPYANTDTTFDFNGSSWTTKATLPTQINYNGGAGVATAALSIGGTSGPFPVGMTPTADVNSFNGTSWTASTAMPSTGNTGQVWSNGSQTSAIATGTASPTAGWSLLWNGASWSSTPSINTFRTVYGNGGSTSGTLVFGGDDYSAPRVTNFTESYSGASFSTKTLTTS